MVLLAFFISLKIIYIIMNENKQIELASRFVNATARHVFLSGKAGTGKTTFLKKLVGTSHKKVLVAAPTGIAAINAGGVTLHSLFQLAPALFVPSDTLPADTSLNREIKTPGSLVRGTRFFAAKRALLRELELLVIDEVSMLRADTLDAIDTMLRHVRRKHAIPFGGVQVLFIGDLMQLPPVVSHDEWQLLKAYYPSLFFFHARALKQDPPVHIELEKIYRQSDPLFIGLLNKLRDNQADQADRALLNKYHKAVSDPGKYEGYVYITTHNHKAERINQQALQRIEQPGHAYDAVVEGDFPENLYPLPCTLHLKEGAQVMFVKNDPSGEGAYFNGKIGQVEHLSGKQIRVAFNDGSPTVTLSRHAWENKKYRLNESTNEIEDKVLGCFSHFPIKLAWAITVHKSQGLSFDKAIIDLSAAFAPGQVYVALSRLTGLGGLILSQALPENLPAPHPDMRFLEHKKPDSKALWRVLAEESDRYLRQQLLQAYDLSELSRAFYWHTLTYNKAESHSAKQAYAGWAQGLHRQVMALEEIAGRFRKQLRQLFATDSPERAKDRVDKAAAYFLPRLKDLSQCIIDQVVEVGTLSGVKAYVGELRDLDLLVYRHTQKIRAVSGLIRAKLANAEPTREHTEDPQMMADRKEMTGGEVSRILYRRKKNTGKKTKEGKATQSSAEQSLELFRQGKGIEDIAQVRKLAISTIQTHMVNNVKNGLLEAEMIVDKEKISQILAASRSVQSDKPGDIMRVLGDEFTYMDVRIALLSVRKD